MQLAIKMTTTGCNAKFKTPCCSRTPFLVGLQAGTPLGGLDCAALCQIGHLHGVQHSLPSGLPAPQAGVPALTAGLAFAAIFFYITHLVILGPSQHTTGIIPVS